MDGGVVIRGDRLTLRSFRPAEIDTEWQAMLTAGAIAVAELPDEAGFRSRLARSGQMREGAIDLAVDLGGESIGRVQTFVPPHRPIPPGTFDLGIGLRGEVRGRGYGGEAVTLLTGWLFEQQAAQLVEAATDPANGAMRAVFRRLGWREEGTVSEIGRDWLIYRMACQDWSRTQSR